MFFVFRNNCNLCLDRRRSFLWTKGLTRASSDGTRWSGNWGETARHCGRGGGQIDIVARQINVLKLYGLLYCTFAINYF